MHYKEALYHWHKTSRKNRTIRYRNITFEVKKHSYEAYLQRYTPEKDRATLVVGNYFLHQYNSVTNGEYKEEVLFQFLCAYCLVFNRNNIPKSEDEMNECIAAANKKIREYYKVNDYDEGVEFLYD